MQRKRERKLLWIQTTNRLAVVLANQTNHPELEPVGSQTSHRGRETQRESPLEEEQQQQQAGNRIRILQEPVLLQTVRELLLVLLLVVHQSRMPRAPERQTQIPRVPERRMMRGPRMQLVREPRCPQN